MGKATFSSWVDTVLYVCFVMFTMTTCSFIPASHSGMATAMLETLSATELSVSVPTDGNEYACMLTAEPTFTMKFNISALPMMTKQLTSLSPDTKYTLHCVGYNADGTESCKVVNRSATTMKRKKLRIKMFQHIYSTNHLPHCYALTLNCTES